MFPSTKALVGLALVTATTAIDSILIPSIVTAGKPVTLRIKTDIGTPDSFDAQFAYYRVYLTISPPGWGLNPVCYLANQTAIDVTSLEVTIPATVGPEASNYTLSVVEYNTDPNSDVTMSGFAYSDEFSLVGATGSFSDYETDPSGPWALGPEDSIPCEAYDCVRTCMQKYYPEDLPNTENIAAMKNAYLCSAQCPGTSYLAWDPAWEGGDNSSPSASASASASATATGTRTTGAKTPGSTATATNSNASPTEIPGAGSVVALSRGLMVAGLVLGLVMRM
jgi:hypothetical protein